MFDNIQGGGQFIFFSENQRQIIFSKNLPAPPDNEMVAPLYSSI